MIDIHLTRRADLFAHLRAMVEAGAADSPARVFRDGTHSLNLGSIHAAACLTVAEEPSTRFAPYAPHPKAVIGPRVGALLAFAKVTRQLDMAARLERRRQKMASGGLAGG